MLLKHMYNTIQYKKHKKWKENAYTPTLQMALLQSWGESTEAALADDRETSITWDPQDGLH